MGAADCTGKRLGNRVDNGRMPHASLHPPRRATEPALLWDVFCRVIDNFGDLGVCWRLSADLAARGHRVRLWVDDASALQWMATGALERTWPGIQILGWEQSQDADLLAQLQPADVWVEGFGCDIATEFIAHDVCSTRAIGQSPLRPPAWINLEYLTAEPFAERCHGLPSPVMSGPAQGRTKHFFYPGFNARTGGLLREPMLLDLQRAFAQDGRRTAWLSQHGLDVKDGEMLVSLLCYEPAALPALLTQLDALPTPTHLLVTAGRASAAVRHATRAAQTGAPPALRQVRITYLPMLTQVNFDQLLWACDLNCVRGEDSLVRALWAGRPLVWQAYPQDDAAHLVKLDAFLDMLGADSNLRAFHHAWNAPATSTSTDALPAIDLLSWSQTIQSVRERLLQMDDLATQLISFVQKKR